MPESDRGGEREGEDLIVDDDEGVRGAQPVALRSGIPDLLGRVGREAVLRGARGDVDLVILDMVLPRVDGMEVLKEITALRPKCRSS